MLRTFRLRRATRVIRLVAPLAFVAVQVSGCRKARNVVFGETAARTNWPADSATVVRVYYDRNGDMYPPGMPALQDEGGIRSRRGEVSLRAYFSRAGTGQTRGTRFALGAAPRQPVASMPSGRGGRPHSVRRLRNA
jgi:hypothetical protein